MSISKPGPISERGVPRFLGRYEVVELLSAGGMGEVFVARTVGPGGFVKPVAIKRIRAHLTGDPAFVDMLHDEARISAAVQHPNIIPVIDVGSEGDDHFIVSEFVSGEHVGRVVRLTRNRGMTLPPWIGAFIVAQVAAALAAVHDARALDGSPLEIIHRDVSPANIMLSDRGHALLFDFGVAKASQRLHETSHGQLKGKLPYMAPETFAGVAPDRSVDVFGLGVVAYELLTGVSPFARTNDLETIAALRNAEIAPPSQLAPGVDEELGYIVLRAMSRERAERYSAAELEQALRAWATSRGAPHDASSAATWLATAFPERLAARRELLARVASGQAWNAPTSQPGLVAAITVPDARADVAVEPPTLLTPTVLTPTVGASTVGGVARYTTSASLAHEGMAPSRRSPWMAMTAGAVLVATVLLVGLAVLGLTRTTGVPPREDARAELPTEPVAAAEPSSTPESAAPGVSEVAPIAEPAAADAASGDPTAAASSAPRPRGRSPRGGAREPGAAPEPVPTTQPGKRGPLAREWD